MAFYYGRFATLEVEPVDGSEAFTVETRISFDVEVFSSVAGNTANIDIYNLSETHRNQIANRNFTGNKFGAKITLRAGYETIDPSKNASVIFKGTIIDAINIFETGGVNWITRIEAKNGIELYTKHIKRTFLKNTLVSAAIKLLITAEIGLPLTPKNSTYIDTVFGQKKLKSAWIINKKAGAVLSDLNSHYGKILKVTFDDLGVNFLSPGIINEEIPLKEIGYKTGLIGAPQLTQTGVILNTVLLPFLKRNQQINLESMILTNISDSGVYVVDKLNHRGDTGDKENEFITQITCLLTNSELIERFGGAISPIQGGTSGVEAG